MRIEGKSIVLRQLKPSDLEAFLAYRTDPDVCKYQGFEVFSQQEAIDFIAKYGQKKTWRMSENGYKLESPENQTICCLETAPSNLVRSSL